MMRNQSVGAEEAGAKRDGGKKEKAAEKAEPFFKTKTGSVFPAKRKSVKKMVCECIIECIIECIVDKCSKSVPPTVSNSKKETSVHPSSPELVHDTDMAD